MIAIQRGIGALVLASILAAYSLSAFAQDAATSTRTAPPITAESPFLQENDVAMAKMMSDMAVEPTGDVNRDFVEMMIPHHQGAIAMAQAQAYLRYGSNEQLKRIAQEIIVDQQQEIAAMRLALGDLLPASTAAPTQVDTVVGTQTAPHSDKNAPPQAPAMQMKMMKTVK